MRSACCCTVSPTTSSTCFVCSYPCRCVPHKSKRCAFSCSRLARASAKQLVASAFTWPAAGLFRISSKPYRSVIPRRWSRSFDNTLSEGPGGAIWKNGSRGQNNDNATLYKGRQRSAILSSVINMLSALRRAHRSGQLANGEALWISTRGTPWPTGRGADSRAFLEPTSSPPHRIQHSSTISTHGSGLGAVRNSQEWYGIPAGDQPQPPEDKRRRADFQHDPRHYRPQEDRRRPATVRSQFPNFGGRQLRCMPRRNGWGIADGEPAICPIAGLRFSGR